MRNYRGLSHDNEGKIEGEWIYGFLAAPDQIMVWNEDNATGEMFQVCPETVGQSTGLLDKNGKEIYFDSDIVEYTYIIENDIETSERTIRGTVVLDLEFTNSLCVKTKGGLSHHFTASENRYLEVIGNIHTTPELLEEKEK